MTNSHWVSSLLDLLLLRSSIHKLITNYSSLSDTAVSLKSHFWFSYFHTCYKHIWSWLLFPPRWHKDCNILVSPVPKPLDSQKDPSAGEHLFISMAAKKKRKTLNIQDTDRPARQYSKQTDPATRKTSGEEALRAVQSVFITHLV